jgi:hypothetical protein
MSSTTMDELVKPPDIYSRMVELWETIMPTCRDVVNTWYKFSIQQVCCTNTTYYPVRSLGCSDLMGDLDSILLKNNSPDAIYYAKEWKEGVPTSFPKMSYETHPNVSNLLSHIPIQLTLPLGKKKITILSWNISGLCNKQKRIEASIRTTTTGTTTVTSSTSQEVVREIVERKAPVLTFIQDQLRKGVEVICLQEIFLPDKSTHTGDKLLIEFCGPYIEQYSVFYDGFIGGMIVKKTLLDYSAPAAPPAPPAAPILPAAPAAPRVRFAGRKTRRVKTGGEFKMMTFPPNQDQKQSVMKIHQDGESLFIVNVCLSPLYHLNQQKIHENEMRFVIEYLNMVKAFSAGVVFIGDHKHNVIEFYNTIRPESFKRR